MLYKSVAQTVLLYGSKSWVVTLAILKLFEGFYHQAARKIVGMIDWRMEDVYWNYPLVDDALEYTGIYTIKGYIQKPQAIIAAQVACRPIYKICTRVERMLGYS